MHPVPLHHPAVARSRGRHALLVLATFTLGACAASAPPPDIAHEQAAVTAVSARWLELEHARDPAGIAALFTPDGVMYREHREPVAGTAAMIAYMTEQNQKNPQQQSGWTTERVDVAPSGDMATEYGSWSEAKTGADGSGHDAGRYVTSYRKVDGEWKVVSDISLSTTPAAAPAAAAPTM
jgi:uncharacterized protein (TIGR02246 family)